MRSPRCVHALLFASVVLGVMSSGCRSNPEAAGTTAAPPVTARPSTVSTAPASAAPAPGKEVEEVKQMLADLQNVKDMDQMADFFTNESAAAFGIVMMIPVAMMAAFEDMGANMAKEMGKSLGANPSAQPPPKPQSGLKIKADLEATLKKYGLTDKADPNDPQTMAKLNTRGRDFLRDMFGLMDKLDKNKSAGDKGVSMTKPKVPINLDDVTYKVLSPTRVDLERKDHKEEKAEARWEDGRWRLHIGDLKTLMQQNKMKMNGMSGMGLGGAPTGTPNSKP